MAIPALGPMTADADYDGHRSARLPVPVFGDAACHVVVVGYGDDGRVEDFDAAIASFLRLDESVLVAAAQPVFEYYLDTKAICGPGEEIVEIAAAGEVWRHVHPGRDVVVQREDYGADQQVYVSVECECAWEPEHGLQVVFRGGQEVTKVGPYDGHLTNAAAYDSAELEGVVYQRLT